MASNNKFHDIVGFLDEVETVPGVWTPEIVEHFPLFAHVPHLSLQLWAFAVLTV